MDALPVELFLVIAVHLPIIALRNFRLTCRKIATIVHPVLVKHLSLLDLLKCLEDFEAFIDSVGPVISTQHLTVYHGRWPVCTREQWEVHPLQPFELHPRFLSNETRSQKDTFAIDGAYQSYKLFMDSESHRHPANEDRLWKNILCGLPNLNTITIAHLHTWDRRHNGKLRYESLRKEIWMSAFFNESVSLLVSRILNLSPLGSLRKIVIRDKFSPAEINVHTKLDNITSLEMRALQGDTITSTNLSRFLSVFPNLEHLSVCLAPGSRRSIPLPVESSLPCLRTLQLSQLWMTEDALVRIICTNPLLSVIELSKITLQNGSWLSLLTRARNLGRELRVHFEGVVNDLRSCDQDCLLTEVIILHVERKYCTGSLNS